MDDSERPGNADQGPGTQAGHGFRRSTRAASALGAALRTELGAALRAASSRWRRYRARPDVATPKRASGVTRTRRNRILVALSGVALAGILVVAGILLWALRDVPWEEIADGSIAPVVVLESADGTPLVQEGPYQGAYTRVDAFPQHLVDAVLSIEDRRFYDHWGVDLRGIARAFMRNLDAGEVVQGGSTITQQLIKISYLERDRTYRRKIQELVIAFWLERRLGKDEILTRYLNNIYLGAGATGVPAAARIYFDKEPGELDLGESAMIAGLIIAPSVLNPIANADRAEERARVVLDAMVANGKISADEAAAAKAAYAELRPTRPASRSGSWFADWAMRDAREIAADYRGTISVATTLEPQLQAVAERVLREALDGAGADGPGQGALVAMGPDGAVLAMVGGRNYQESTFNRAVDARRQPGSTFKTFVLLSALQAGIDPRALVPDEPITIDGWTPENFGGRYYGLVPIYEAFVRSLNAAMVVLAQEVGIGHVAAAARDLGIDAELTETPALALGASEVTLIDLTGAYASILAGVAPVEPWGIVSFRTDETRDGFRVGPSRRPDIDISPFRDDLIRLLSMVVEQGTGQAARVDGFSAGKTGTSQNYRDAWFVGFTENLVVGVWVGNDDDTPMKGVTGGALPASIFKSFIDGTSVEALAAQSEAGGSVDEGRAGSGEVAAQSCNVQACARAYRSFRSSDCSYQPYRGSRRLCER
ncbi:PBP1A family penicillin-binding protein [Aliihoeflea sp. 2WW]|uniref:PBP1A family penicillin-binding protein n=1 Tax=Aliihoeflea sp. 2WW TaxID=1381123 RepID=UPI000465417C|nr:PBP1A family penicillin-binding protein [Aliihoeflea sp. 2WW]